MASISWKDPVSGSWTLGSNWDSGTVPSSSDDVTIGIAGGYTVSIVDENAQANSLTIGSTAANLSIVTSNGGVAAKLAIGTELSNSGTLDVDVFGGDGGSTLTIGGTFSNTGSAAIGVTNLSAATTVIAGGLVNTGLINLTSQQNGARATLSLVGPGTAGAAASLNTGSIISNADGIAVNGAARLVNGSSGSAAGLISAGYSGVVLSNNGALVNYGTVKATQLVNYGTVKGTQTGVSLEPAGSGARVAVSNYGFLSGAVGIIDGGAAGTSDRVINRGRITGTSGAGITLGSGADRVDNFGTISGSNGTAVAFGNGAGTVVIEPGAVFNGALGGFSSSDVIDFAYVAATGFSFAGGALTLINHGTVVPGAVIAVTGTFSPANLTLASDGSGGVDIGIAPGRVIVGTYYSSIGLSNPLTVTSTGRIAPSYGDAIISGAGVPGTVINCGTIAANGPAGIGISLAAGGLVANCTLGYISGSLAGIKIGGGVATITNAGTIRGGSGILIAAGSSATVSNAGTIAGTSGNAVSLAGGTNRLILAPGASLQGKADGGGGNSVVEVATSLVGLGAAGGATGAADTAAAIYVNLGSVTNFSALQVDPGAATDVDGNLSFGTLVNQGQINLLAGDALVVGTVAGAASGGTVDLKGGGSVHFTGAVAAGQTVLFRTGGSVALDHPEQFAAAITQFAATDLINLPLGTAGFQQYAAGILSLNYGGGTVALQLATIYATPQFQFTGDGHGGTDILVSDAVCFCRGTMILTERGEVAVEDLAVGERVRTLSGALKPIVWIGMGRDLVTRANKLARPVVVRADALADGVPHRDLYLTHGHALYLDGVLIPVENLINHRSILWDELARVVEYYHIELEDHDVVLANGAPAETYYDASNRAQFHNARPGSIAGKTQPTFAPVLTGGPVVERAWTMLFERSGGRIARDTTDDPDLHLIVGRRRVEPTTIEDDSYSFALAGPPAGGLLICSRNGVPSLVGVTTHDHRWLGVALARIVISQPGIMTLIEPDAPVLLAGGCHPAEGRYSWTDGELTLPPDLFAHLSGPFTVTVEIQRPGMRYPLGAELAATA